MKAILKSLARSLWGLTGPVRRPLARKFEATLDRVLRLAVREEIQAQVHPRFDGVEHGVNLARGEVSGQGIETNLSLDSLVREIGRLQMQVETLQRELAARDEAGGLALVAGHDGAHGYANGQAKVG